MTPDLRPYATLLTAFLSRRIEPTEFQDIMIPLFKNDTYWRPQEIYETLNEIFEAAEAFEPNASAGDPYEMTEDQLYSIAETGLRRLKDVADPA